MGYLLCPWRIDLQRREKVVGQYSESGEYMRKTLLRGRMARAAILPMGSLGDVNVLQLEILLSGSQDPVECFGANGGSSILHICTDSRVLFEHSSLSYESGDGFVLACEITEIE